MRVSSALLDKASDNVLRKINPKPYNATELSNMRTELSIIFLSLPETMEYSWTGQYDLILRDIAKKELTTHYRKVYSNARNMTNDQVMNLIPFETFEERVKYLTKIFTYSLEVIDINFVNLSSNFESFDFDKELENFLNSTE